MQLHYIFYLLFSFITANTIQPEIITDRDVFHIIKLEEVVRKSDLILIVRKSHEEEKSKDPTYVVDEILMNIQNKNIPLSENIGILPAYHSAKLKAIENYNKPGERKSFIIDMYQPFDKENKIFSKEKLIVFLKYNDLQKWEFAAKNAFDLISRKKKIMAEITRRKKLQQQ